VAPIELKLGALLGSLFPEFSARILRKIASETSAAIIEAQREKR
jgi:hypothetical protein